MPYPTPYNLMNPQQQYMNYFQQMQQPLQQSMQQQLPLNQLSTGKIVDGIEMVKATDIPIDGNNYYFPKADGSEVYSKRWLQDGRTEINTYVKLNAQQEEENKRKIEDDIIEKLNLIDDRIAKLEKGLIKPASKKE